MDQYITIGDKRLAVDTLAQHQAAGRALWAAGVPHAHVSGAEKYRLLAATAALTCVDSNGKGDGATYWFDVAGSELGLNGDTFLDCDGGPIDPINYLAHGLSWWVREGMLVAVSVHQGVRA